MHLSLSTGSGRDSGTLRRPWVKRQKTLQRRYSKKPETGGRDLAPPPLGTRFMQAAFYPRWRVFRLECMNRRDSRRRALLRWLCKEP